MIKAIIFDCFGVLYESKISSFGHENVPANQYEAYRAAIKQMEYGRYSRKQFVEVVSKLSDLSPSVIEEELFSSKYSYNNALLEYIRKLRKKYKISMITNLNADSFDEIVAPIEKQFDDIIASYQVGVIKPSAEIYRLAADRLGVETKECVFIDDSQENCEAAKLVGMRAILYDNFPQMKRESEKILASP